VIAEPATNVMNSRRLMQRPPSAEKRLARYQVSAHLAPALLTYSITSLACTSSEGGTVRPSNLGDLDVDYQLELSRLLDGEVGGLGPLQDLVHEGGSPPLD